MGRAQDGEVDRAGRLRQGGAVHILDQQRAARHGRVAGALEGLAHPLLDRLVGLALGADDLGVDIGRGLAEPDRHRRQGRHMDADQLGAEAGREGRARAHPRLVRGLVAQLLQDGAIGHCGHSVGAAPGQASSLMPMATRAPVVIQHRAPEHPGQDREGCRPQADEREEQDGLGPLGEPAQIIERLAPPGARFRARAWLP